MTELELYKFIDEYAIECRWEEYEDKEDEFLIWIPFYLLNEFTEMIGCDYLSEGGIMVNLQEGCICLDLVDIAEYHEIDLENILSK